MYLTRSTRSAIVAALAARGHDGTPPTRGLHAVQYEGSDANTPGDVAIVDFVYEQEPKIVRYVPLLPEPVELLPSALPSNRLTDLEVWTIVVMNKDPAADCPSLASTWREVSAKVAEMLDKTPRPHGDDDA